MSREQATASGFAEAVRWLWTVILRRKAEASSTSVI
jgi:hypothetical protein